MISQTDAFAFAHMVKRLIAGKHAAGARLMQGDRTFEHGERALRDIEAEADRLIRKHERKA